MDIKQGWLPMSVNVPQLTLFPLYRGGPQVQGRSGVNANSAFYTQANAFSPAYAVNIPPATSRDFSTSYLTMGNSGSKRIEQRSTSQIRDFDRPVWLGEIPGSIRQAPVPAVAPVIPNIYQAMADLLAVTDAHYDDLMAQPSFRIPTIGLGLKVTTDGMGGVDTIEISPSSRKANPRTGETSPDFSLQNRTDVTSGAMMGADTGVGLSIKRPVKPTSTIDNPPQPLNTQQPGLGDLANPFQKDLGRNAGIFNLQRPGALPPQPPVNLRDLNPIQQRLFQLQPPELGLAVSGAGAAVAADQARQIATVKARLEVNTSTRTKDNIANLASGGKQAESYAAAFRPQTMDGRIPMAPSLPNAFANAGGASTGFGGSDGFNLGGAVSDAMNRKGRGGYIPFQMQGQDAGTSGGGAGASPFFGSGSQQGGMGFGAGQGGMSFGMGSGNQGDQPRQRRRPLAFTA
jgi:hypothetical protein